MAQLYSIEPQTTAKVLLKTTFGDLELELWGRECPLTVKNFLQLCYNGYYNSTVFHRLVPGFILQGGDPTGTGHGGEAIYDGGLFKDEFHPRLKYNRRGLLGMANSGTKDDNGSQFFFTLGECRELQGKNTLFGKIEGQTIYNLVRMGELEVVEGTERPVFPPMVKEAEVLVNSWPEEIKPREVTKAEEVKKNEGPKKPKKKGRQMLSFVDPEDGEDAAPVVKKKPKFDTRLVDAPSPSPPPQRKHPFPPPPPPPPPPAQSAASPPSPPAQEKRKRMPPPTRRARSRSISTTPPPPSRLEQTNAQIAALRASLRRSPSPPRPSAATAKKKSLLALQKELLPATSIQGRKRKRADRTDVEDFAALETFKARLAAAPATGAASRDTDAKKEMGDEEEQQECDLHFIPGCLSCRAWDKRDGEEGEGEGDTAEIWGHTLTFEKDRLGKDLNWKKKNEELVVIDPREKAREIVGKRKGRDGDRHRGGRSRAGPSGGGDWRGRGR